MSTALPNAKTSQSAVDEFSDALTTIVLRLVDAYRPQTIILFGSLAWGTPHADSDIDLLIVKESQETPLQRRLRVRKMVAEASRRIPFSPLVLTPDELQSRLDLNDPFYRQIVEQGQLLYERQ